VEKGKKSGVKDKGPKLDFEQTRLLSLVVLLLWSRKTGPNDHWHVKGIAQFRPRSPG
jgi:hypothetical protein